MLIMVSVRGGFPLFTTPLFILVPYFSQASSVVNSINSGGGGESLSPVKSGWQFNSL